MRDALTAAAGALVIALLNEARARSAARAARIERAGFRSEVVDAARQGVTDPPADSTISEDR